MCSKNRGSRSELPPAQKQLSGQVELKRRPRQSTGTTGLWKKLVGDWELYWSCPICKRQNESNVFQCPFCGYIASNIHDVSASGQPPMEGTITSMWNRFLQKVLGTEAAQSTERSDPVEVRGWSCPDCKFINHPDLAYCEQCRYGLVARDSIEQCDDRELHKDEQQPNPPLEENGTAPSLVPSDSVPVPNPSSGVHAELSPQLDVWVCPYCTAHNRTQNLNCHVCEIGMRPWSGDEDECINVSHTDSWSSSYATRRHSSHSLTVQEIREIEEGIAMDIYRNIVEEYKKVSIKFLHAVWVN